MVRVETLLLSRFVPVNRPFVPAMICLSSPSLSASDKFILKAGIHARKPRPVFPAIKKTCLQALRR